jgi:hypothetical protein
MPVPIPTRLVKQEEGECEADSEADKAVKQEEGECELGVR